MGISKSCWRQPPKSIRRGSERVCRVPDLCERQSLGLALSLADATNEAGELVREAHANR